MSTYKIILSSDTTHDDDDYIQHFGVLGMKWGVRRTPEQLGHHKARNKQETRKQSPKKTYEFEPYPLEFQRARDLFKSSLTWPYKMISETYKRQRDPEYKKKSNEFISQHKEELLRQFLVSVGLAQTIYQQ